MIALRNVQGMGREGRDTGGGWEEGVGGKTVFRAHFLCHFVLLLIRIGGLRIP